MKGKWDFLEQFVESYSTMNPDAAVVEIAEKAIAAFNLTLDREQVRKVVSRIVNSKKETEAIWEVPITTTVTDRTIPHSPRIVLLDEAAFSPAKPTIAPVGDSLPSFKHNQEGQYLVLGCWHVPFHNRKMTDGVLKLMESLDLQGVIFNGDFLDCNSLSGHDRGRFTAIPNLTLKQEYQEGLKVLTEFNKQIPKTALKVYMYGNHEDRYWRFVNEMQNAKTPPQSPREGLKLDELGFISMEHYADNYLTLGDHLDVIHGIFFSDHCAKKHIDRFRGSCLFAHTHRIQSYIEGNVGGFNIGWGGDKQSPAFRYADRAMKASWQNGFAIVNIDNQGDYYVQQVICNDGNFYYNGKRY